MAIRDGKIITVKIKAGVQWLGQSLPCVRGIFVAALVYDAHQENQLVITSLHEGPHKPGSRHYTGDAVDIRLPANASVQQIANDIRTCLGFDYDVIVEATHIHIEWDPVPKPANE